MVCLLIGAAFTALNVWLTWVVTNGVIRHASASARPVRQRHGGRHAARHAGRNV